MRASSFFGGQMREWETVCCLMCHLFHLGDTHLVERHKQRLILCRALAAAWEGFFVAPRHLFTHFSLAWNHGVSRCSPLRTIAKVPLKFNFLGMNHKWYRIYSWIALLCHHLLLAADFLIITDKTIKESVSSMAELVSTRVVFHIRNQAREDFSYASKMCREGRD